ncbi:helix-turn-helix transcriptional regulator [Defluviitalea raffinosedens]|uniref:helix-turn-helix transcriptional regulator n=1 Tax=Defluviitalea raffinosedens TaxID=1450156 RepID=UPI002ED448FB
MLGWIEGIQRAIEYIEDHLTEELNIHEIAEKACVSAFYFQKILMPCAGLQ